MLLNRAPCYGTRPPMRTPRPTRPDGPIDRLSRTIGHVAVWAILAMLVLQTAIVLLRHAFGIGFVAMQEAAIYLNAAIVLFGAAALLARDGHVRVDILYRDLPPRRRALVDLAGAATCILPFALVLLWTSLPYAARSFAIYEASREAGGLPGIFLAKAMLPLGAGLLGLQALATATAAWRVLRSPG